MKKFLDDSVVIHNGDCLKVLPTLLANSADSCVTDPPYHLVSIVKRFGSPNSKPVRVPDPNAVNCLKAAHARAAAGFMGKTWDGGDIAARPKVWREVYRVLKPGAHLLAFGGTRTFHRMACAIEDAGFEIRDTIMWLYGSGFPKSHNAGNGWGTALKPACEPIILARKPLSEKTVAANVLKWGTGALNIDGTRIPLDGDYKCGANGRPSQTGLGDNYDPTKANQHSNVGRWPANLIHDGSEEVLAGFPETGVSAGGRIGNAGGGAVQNIPTGQFSKGDPGFGDSGSAARFFYTAKADQDTRLGSNHPTIKPLDLIRYLVRLVTPPKGVCLDPFCGTGTTGEAAWREGMRAVLIEAEKEYQADVVTRLTTAKDYYAREVAKMRRHKTVDMGPFFQNKDKEQCR